jgi:hypothetical protein
MSFAEQNSLPEIVPASCFTNQDVQFKSFATVHPIAAPPRPHNSVWACTDDRSGTSLA